jgi:hypothetical protein
MQLTHRDPRQIAAGAIALILWLATVLFALFEVYLLRQTALHLAYRLGATVSAGTLAADIVVLILALVWVVFTFGTGEFHRRHAGQPASWRAFAWTFGIEAVLAVPYFLI